METRTIRRVYTVTAYLETEDAEKALKISETLQRVSSGFVLEGGVEVGVRLRMDEIVDDEDGA